MNPSQELRKKSIHDLRVLAQAFGVTDIFEKDSIHLAQAIEAKQEAITQPKAPLPERPPYDPRIMLKRPSLKSSPIEIVTMLEPFVKMGMKLSFDEESWFIAWGDRNDTGTLRMPPRNVLICAEKMMK